MKEFKITVSVCSVCLRSLMPAVIDPTQALMPQHMLAAIHSFIFCSKRNMTTNRNLKSIITCCECHITKILLWNFKLRKLTWKRTVFPPPHAGLNLYSHRSKPTERWWCLLCLTESTSMTSRLLAMLRQHRPSTGLCGACMKVSCLSITSSKTTLCLGSTWHWSVLFSYHLYLR